MRSPSSLLELAHGAARADTQERKLKREQYNMQELITAVPIYPVTTTIALRVGQMDGASQAKGICLPLADLLIGVTALELGYAVATGNLRQLQADSRTYRDTPLADHRASCPCPILLITPLFPVP